ncbi:MAG: UvrABC system protein A [Candidatus Pacebacteria bacterium GW2011_GWF2_38_9]|nr:MAG: excinuclease ABC subunit A, excinuclease ABC subunit A [candidate division TM6 bacterium GW2011_GWF2_28_16]KKQ10064.1 MAG: UvrABC system protein A [Candidatus Pacebacteria bacterium GW2011_GWF1_36_5]KKQ89021.1 MAG: UvrABC system protein A [Candidatus Pacebacteria bacterium GW2011_GWF2_38_9]
MALRNTIKITGAREHNLKNINLEFEKNQLIVFTGLSGSGKSSLAFDTLYAEGQRRYVESLSSYARQFLGVMNKPDVDQIDGLSPAISIDQKTTSHNPRSTVGTITEIYDYCRLLFARVGHPHCHNCGKEISTQSIDQIITQIFNQIEEKFAKAKNTPQKIMILSPVIKERKGEFDKLLQNLIKKGYNKARIDGQIYNLDQELNLIKTNKHSIDALIDRLVISKVQLNDKKESTILKSRLNQSIEEALKLAGGLVIVSWVNDSSFTFPENPQDTKDFLFSENLACSDCGISLKELEPRSFSFNSPEGACPKCNGLGSILKINPDRIIAPSLTMSEGAVIPFARMMGNEGWFARLVRIVLEDFSADFRMTKWEDMSKELQDILLYGSEKIYDVVGENRFGNMTSYQSKFEGFIKNLERRYTETDSEFIRREINQFMHKEVCPDCKGARLKEEVLSVTIDEINISQFSQLTIDRSLKWIEKVSNPKEKILSAKELQIATSILKEIKTRLHFLSAVGLNYLTISREAASLAGGEAQRIRLASQIGTGLTGVLYILDEPTIGLHQRDNRRLIETLQELKNKGNTIVVVEHDRDIMMAADHIIDFGPKAGSEGGEIVFDGSYEEILKAKDSLTGKYLSRKKEIKREKTANKKDVHKKAKIAIHGAKYNNLKNIDVEIPLNALTCITGISGSGKSTLLHNVLHNHLAKNLGYTYSGKLAEVEKISIPPQVKRLSMIDQSPIGKTPRSNPATYTKAFDYIRQIFARTKDAAMRGYKIGRFSFNVKGGRCEACQGEGQIKIEMQFLPDVYVECDVCHGQRYNEETLQVLYQDKNIAQVLDLSIDEAFDFFKNHSNIRQRMQTLKEVGLGYLKLGQPAPTLSGGEAQRVKLAKELSTRSHDHLIYLLDEPTTGLHFADIQKLLNVLHQLVEQDNTVILIEHNLDVIKNADWLIDLGPEGGEYGGEVVAFGTPAEVAENEKSFTGHYLKEELSRN